MSTTSVELPARRRWLIGWAFVAPAVALFLLMGAYTIVSGFLLSFAKWNGFTPEWRWAGLGNYADLLYADPSLTGDLRRAAGNTAQVNGAGEARIFWSVYLPLAKPAHITVAVLTAVPTWNEYVLTRVSLSDRSLFTLPLGLESLISSEVPRYNEVMAAFGIDSRAAAAAPSSSGTVRTSHVGPDLPDRGHNAEGRPA